MVAAADPEGARELVWYAKNFEVKECYVGGTMSQYLRRLPLLPSGEPRTLTRYIFLDNGLFSKDVFDVEVHSTVDQEFDRKRHACEGLR